MSTIQTQIVRLQVLSNPSPSSRLFSITKRSSANTDELIRRLREVAQEKEVLLQERALVQALPELSSTLADQEKVVLRERVQNQQEEIRRLKEELEKTNHRSEERLALQKLSTEQEIAALRDTLATKEEEIRSLKTKAKIDSDVALAEKRAIEETSGFRLTALEKENLEMRERLAKSAAETGRLKEVLSAAENENIISERLLEGLHSSLRGDYAEDYQIKIMTVIKERLQRSFSQIELERLKTKIDLEKLQQDIPSYSEYTKIREVVRTLIAQNR